MRILNLGCGSKTSQYPEVISIDWSVKLIIKNNIFFKFFISSFLSKERINSIESLPDNIVVHNLRKGIPFESNSVDVVYHSHLLEHLDRKDVDKFLKEIFRVLKTGGIQRIVVPDFYSLCQAYLNDFNKCQNNKKFENVHDKFIGAIIEQCVRKEAHGSSKQNKFLRNIENIFLGDSRQRGETHQWMYDKFNLGFILSEAGFSNIKIMSFDNSDIKNWQKYELDTNHLNEEYKPGSLYIEATK